MFKSLFDNTKIIKKFKMVEEQKSEQPDSPSNPLTQKPKITVDDFEFYKNVGEGSFG